MRRVLTGLVLLTSLLPSFLALPVDGADATAQTVAPYLTAGRPEAAHLWAYALAFRLSGDAYLWEMARNIARGNGWGAIGECVSLSHRMGEGRGEGKATPKLRLSGNVSDFHAEYGNSTGRVYDSADIYGKTR